MAGMAMKTMLRFIAVLIVLNIVLFVLNQVAELVIFIRGTR